MRRKTLLLINSSQVLMDLTKKILERADYSVRCAVGIAGAREQLMDFIPDGIVLDNDLPDGKGFDFCCELRRESTVPIMLLSNIKEDELSALQAGANDFLKKPFDYEIMKTRIGIMLNPAFVSYTSGYGKDAERSTVLFLETDKKEQRLQSVQTEPEDDFVKKKRLPKAKRLYITTAACLAFMFITVWVFNTLNSTPDIFIADEQVPLSGFTFQLDENAKPYMGTDQIIQFPGINSPTIRADTADMKILLLNPDGNRCYFSFEIVLTDTGESLYSSGMVEPGMYIDEITLSRVLAKGEYNASIKIRAYALENFAIINGVTMELCLTTG